MAPLKPYFTGQTESTTRTRATITCQKCIRTGDIENVGRQQDMVYSFEMLETSFGDYQT